jgi:hypothetical protein
LAAGQANGSASGQPGGPAPDPAAPLRVSARHLNLALDELLDTRHDLTRVLLGSRPIRGADAVIRPVLPHLRPSRLPRVLHRRLPRTLVCTSNNIWCFECGDLGVLFSP